MGNLPEPKPNFYLRFFMLFALGANGVPGMICALTGLAMVLTFLAVVSFR